MPDKILVSGDNVSITIIGKNITAEGKDFFIHTQLSEISLGKKKIPLSTLVKNAIKKSCEHIPHKIIDGIKLSTKKSSPPFTVFIK